jgi:diguanylate cyclase (GGDEF)-like protein
MVVHDVLIGFPNSRLIMDQLRHTLEFNMKNRRTLACVYFDLDGFKQVNDTLGHGAGDFLLQEVGRRTRAMLRDSDLLARLGGDEFSIVLDSVQSRSDAELICRRVVSVVEDITEIMGHPINVSVSVGCVIVSPESLAAKGETSVASEEDVMRLADACMYQSKKSGSGRYTIDSFPAGNFAGVAA